MLDLEQSVYIRPLTVCRQGYNLIQWWDNNFPAFFIPAVGRSGDRRTVICATNICMKMYRQPLSQSFSFFKYTQGMFSVCELLQRRNVTRWHLKRSWPGLDWNTIISATTLKRLFLICQKSMSSASNGDWLLYKMPQWHFSCQHIPYRSVGSCWTNPKPEPLLLSTLHFLRLSILSHFNIKHCVTHQPL